jgi:UDP-glucose 4-epimerase
MQNQRVLITGGAGLIGSHIADLLVGRGIREIVVLDNFVRGRRENLTQAMSTGLVTIVEGDIRDRKLLAEVMQGIDVVFHQAAIRITQCGEDPRLALEVLVDGTFNVAEQAVKSKISKIVAASSASIYGMAEEFPTAENHHPYHNRTFYGAAKAFNEGLLRSFNEMYGLRYVMLRYFNAYGPRMDMHGVYTEVLIRWMERIAAGKGPLIFGDGNQTMDFVYAEDIARANLAAAEADISDEVFNVASGSETSLNDLARALLRAMGSNAPLEYGPERKVNPVPRRLADVSRARLMLSFQPTVSLEEGLRRLVAWWQAERQAHAAKLEAERQAAHDLAIAKEVQSRLFPRRQPPLRTLDYAGLCYPARAVGGDYYDFLDLGGGRLGLVIGDIAGKGVAAALLMANLQANLRSQSATAWAEPERFLQSANQLFYENTGECDYATLFFAEYDDQTRLLRYSNCGHPPAFLLRRDGTLEQLGSTSTVMGLFDEWDCSIQDRELSPGDTVMLYTDGATEAFSQAGEEFGDERLLEALRRHRELPSKELLAAVTDQVRQFGPQEQADDITLIVAKCR